MIWVPSVPCFPSSVFLSFYGGGNVTRLRNRRKEQRTWRVLCMQVLGVVHVLYTSSSACTIFGLRLRYVCVSSAHWYAKNLKPGYLLQVVTHVEGTPTKIDDPIRLSLDRVQEKSMWPRALSL
jgi:hypothetical protein